MKIGDTLQTQGAKFLVDGTRVKILTERLPSFSNQKKMRQVRVLCRSGLDALWYVDESILRPLEKDKVS